jgi:hypothetical protein
MLTILDIYTREALAIAANFPATCWTCGPIRKK